MKPKHQRAIILTIALAVMGLGFTLVLSNLGEHLLYYYTPSELATLGTPPPKAFRLGGMVKEGSLEQLDGQQIRFVVTDFSDELTAEYSGITPDLFREGQGVVATGTLNSEGVFVASEILAKHDENYMPPAIADKIQQGKDASQQPDKAYGK